MMHFLLTGFTHFILTMVALIAIVGPIFNTVALFKNKPPRS
jgi:hypothetical protein